MRIRYFFESIDVYIFCPWLQQRISSKVTALSFLSVSRDVLLTRHQSLKVSSGSSQPEEEKEVNRSKFPSFKVFLLLVFLKLLASDPYIPDGEHY